jgi:4-hydroxy-tetrahydrodipicolinate reductase
MTKINVIVGGACGRMGSKVVEHIQKNDRLNLAGAIESGTNPNIGKKIGDTIIEPADILSKIAKDADIYVDFTTPSACEKNSITTIGCGLNAVIGTTGLSEKQIRNIEESVAKNKASGIISPNFSVGVNVFWKVNQLLARYMKDADIEIMEVHHNKKKDSPSGTAKKTLEIISNETKTSKFIYERKGEVGERGNEIGIFAIRGGDVVGEHTVMYFGDGERLEFTHRAHSRDCFAAGCVKSIIWISGKKDGKLHTISEVLGL